MLCTVFAKATQRIRDQLDNNVFFFVLSEAGQTTLSIPQRHLHRSFSPFALLDSRLMSMTDTFSDI
jgi:hypothetical protein